MNEEKTTKEIERATSKVVKDQRGFEHLEIEGVENLRVQQSSAAVYEPPGSSKLWIGEAHLSLPQVRALIDHLVNWESDGTFTDVDEVLTQPH